MAEGLSEAIAKRQAEVDVAEAGLSLHTGILQDQVAAKLHRVGELQRELIDLKVKRQLVSPQYQTFRSLSDNHVHLICLDGEFEELPDYIRHQGPWQSMGRGEVTNLKLDYRLALARDGYALVKCELAVFKPETC
jgi:hypothetical protein